MSIPSIQRLGGVQNAIAVASERTGIDFNYLLGQAQVESGMRSDARAGTSTATGLYQFIEQSWLGVLKQHGAEHGLGWAANSIKQNSAGRFVVTDPAARREILSLRNNPTAASLMAAEHASDNKDALEASLGRGATGTDLYMAHFLGLGGARKFLGAMDNNSGRSAAALFPAAARANKNVFYANDGSPRSLGEVYNRFAAKLDKGAAAVGATGLASDALGSPKGAAFGNDPNVEVVLGTEAKNGDHQWLASTLDQLNATKPGMLNASLLRPNPANARLAYLMLANLGG
jgi:hypothetical protein